MKGYKMTMEERRRKKAESQRKWVAGKREKYNQYMKEYMMYYRKFGAIKNWTEWHPLPYEILCRLSDKNHKLYCEWWCKAHPLNMKLDETDIVAKLSLSH